MPVIRRHGQRWAVHDDPGLPPIGEYETRELAELAARDIPGELRFEDGDRGLDGGGDADAPPSQPDTNTGMEARESPRERQAGL